MNEHSNTPLVNRVLFLLLKGSTIVSPPRDRALYAKFVAILESIKRGRPHTPRAPVASCPLTFYWRIFLWGCRPRQHKVSPGRLLVLCKPAKIVYNTHMTTDQPAQYTDLEYVRITSDFQTRLEQLIRLAEALRMELPLDSSEINPLPESCLKYAIPNHYPGRETPSTAKSQSVFVIHI